MGMYDEGLAPALSTACALRTPHPARQTGKCGWEGLQASCCLRRQDAIYSGVCPSARVNWWSNAQVFEPRADPGPPGRCRNALRARTPAHFAAYARQNTPPSAYGATPLPLRQPSWPSRPLTDGRLLPAPPSRPYAPLSSPPRRSKAVAGRAGAAALKAMIGLVKDRVPTVDM